MRWNDRKVATGLTLACALAGCSVFDGVRASASERNAPPAAPAAQPDEVPMLGDPYTIDGQRFEPRDDATFDETGYAIAGMAADSDLPEAMTITHRTLPIPSYAEVTNLDTGRTVLVRIVARGPMLKNRIAALSPAVARELGLSGNATLPIRLRRTNPPMAERAALRAGRAAAPRLDTPPSLLSALKRRLAESGATDAPVAAVKPAAKPVSKPVAKPVPPKPASRPRPAGAAGADFDSPAVTPVPTAKPVAAPKPAPVAAPKSASAKGSAYIQLGAFRDAARANALAAKAGARVEEAGGIYRVRMGPYASDAAASAALGQLRAKGYREARVQH